jgi:hypothetical protein
MKLRERCHRITSGLHLDNLDGLAAVKAEAVFIDECSMLTDPHIWASCGGMRKTKADMWGTPVAISANDVPPMGGALTTLVGDAIQCAPVQPGIPQGEQGRRQVHLSGPLRNADVIALTTNHRAPGDDPRQIAFREAQSMLRELAEYGEKEVPERVIQKLEEAGAYYYHDIAREEQLADVARRYDEAYDNGREAYVAAHTHATLNMIAEHLRERDDSVTVKTRIPIHQANFSTEQIQADRGRAFVRQVAGVQATPNLEETIRHQLLNSPAASRVVPQVQKLWRGQRVLVTANLGPSEGIVNGLQATIGDFIFDGDHLLVIKIILDDGSLFLVGQSKLNEISMPGIGKCFEVGFPIASATLQTFNKFQGMTLSADATLFVEVDDGMPLT